MDICKEVLQDIVEMIEKRKLDIAEMINTQYSFEEWFNWESFLWCKNTGKYGNNGVLPKLCYSEIIYCKEQKSGDLYVEDEDSGVLIEFSLFFKYTSAKKWIKKIEGDREKLLSGKKAQRKEGFTENLFFVQSVIYDMDSEQNQLKNLSFWSMPTIFSDKINMISGSNLGIKAWQI
jgi:hypothetical protein